MLTDYFYYHPLYKTLPYMINRIPVYMYKFSYRGEYSNSQYTRVNCGNGAVHGDDLLYLFDSPADFSEGLNMEDQLASDTLVQTLTIFAKLDDPNLAKCSDMKPMCEYTHFYKNEAGAFDIEKTSEFDMKLVDLWDQLEEISGHQKNAGRSKRHTNVESTTKVFGVIKYTPEESNDDARGKPSKKGRFIKLRDTYIY